MIQARWTQSHPMRLLITGGAGFIGAHLLTHMLERYPQYQIYNIDALTYAGDTQRVQSMAEVPNYCFIQADLRNQTKILELFQQHRFTSVIHLAAESHVDRSIQNPIPFLQSNTLGTLHLLEAARMTWATDSFESHMFYHISTDEVYGTLGTTGVFHEQSPYQPRSPYSASKAAADHLVRAYATTYQLPTMISHASNNYGPWQYPEKLIPLAILRFMDRKPVPMYGQGEQMREWLYVSDHVSAIDRVFHQGKCGETYHIGSQEVCSNRELLTQLAELMAQHLHVSTSTLQSLIQSVSDRPGHDFRYALEGKKIREELNWRPKIGVQDGLHRTIRWYIDHAHWVRHIQAKAARHAT